MAVIQMPSLPHRFHLYLFTSLHLVFSRLKIFQNEMGSFLSMTSSSSRIFNSYQVTNPALQVIVAALKGHIEIYKDSGLFTALLTIR